MHQWHPAEGWDIYWVGPLTYSLRFPLSYPSSEPWRKVEQCAGTKALVCPLMCLKKQDLYRKFRGQVQAASARGRSPRVVSPYLEYFFQGESQG